MGIFDEFLKYFGLPLDEENTAGNFSSTAKTNITIDEDTAVMETCAPVEDKEVVPNADTKVKEEEKISFPPEKPVSKNEVVETGAAKVPVAVADKRRWLEVAYNSGEYDCRGYFQPMFYSGKDLQIERWEVDSDFVDYSFEITFGNEYLDRYRPLWQGDIKPLCRYEKTQSNFGGESVNVYRTAIAWQVEEDKFVCISCSFGGRIQNWKTAVALANWLLEFFSSAGERKICTPENEGSENEVEEEQENSFSAGEEEVGEVKPASIDVETFKPYIYKCDNILLDKIYKNGVGIFFAGHNKLDEKYLPLIRDSKYRAGLFHDEEGDSFLVFGVGDGQCVKIRLTKEDKFLDRDAAIKVFEWLLAQDIQPIKKTVEVKEVVPNTEVKIKEEEKIFSSAGEVKFNVETCAQGKSIAGGTFKPTISKARTEYLTRWHKNDFPPAIRLTLEKEFGGIFGKIHKFYSAGFVPAALNKPAFVTFVLHTDAQISDYTKILFSADGSFVDADSARQLINWLLREYSNPSGLESIPLAENYATPFD